MKEGIKHRMRLPDKTWGKWRLRWVSEATGSWRMKERQRRYRLRGGKEDSALPRLVPGDGSVVLSWVFPRKDGAF